VYGQPFDEYRPPRRRSSVPGLILAGGLAIAAVTLAFRSAGLLRIPRPAVHPRSIAARGDLAADEKNTIDLFEQCSKSVVYVSPLIRRTERIGFFYRNVMETATASGFVWDRDGHVVTNFHVIKDATRCLVTLPDNSQYEAERTGYWADKDIAVLRIDAPADKLFPVAVGSSSDLRVGQKVFAIGNPFGLDFTLTTGIVSALNREIQSVSGRTIQGVIQTDAAINPGNSGGPLLDSAGRLIGMNTAIYSKSGGSAGIGFAVPVDIINQVVPQLISQGKVTRPGLGINPAPESIRQQLGLNGVLILSVAEDSGARRAGLRPTTETKTGHIVLGDIIVKVGDTATPDLNTLLNALEHYRIGDTVELTIIRQDRQKKVSVTLQAIE